MEGYRKKLAYSSEKRKGEKGSIRSIDEVNSFGKLSSDLGELEPV
jgi:hypothetical protein